MAESIVSIILGAFVTWSLVARYKTINSDNFIKSTQITVFIFASFALGLSLMDIEKTVKITHVLTKHPQLKLILYASPALCPMIIKILQGNTFSSAFELNTNVILVPVALFFALNYMLVPGNNKLFLVVYFTIFAITLGFLHSVLGGIISSFNIALIVASYFKQRVLNIDLNNIFDVLEQIGVASPTLKWVIVVASTIIGLQGCLNSQSVRDFFR